MRTIVHREPIGVVGAIVAWNVPLLLVNNKLGPALLASCTVVLRSAAETPLNADCEPAARRSARRSSARRGLA
ncbi:hypothetical protein AWC22_00895 [Mycobacterium riyadhense]|uniref:Aldehyde dehydrogenase domain-containing protein n=1 Tax=Mycobacterium riyadhense TaxID=486698 RepID=A0A1X2CWJ5_9MYCO|nr:aldehyde dehydrogenase family protein [Mycobacterium riyadhense]ORW80243.1 hypothetical protein AWC22_00895 [Mycobacterium riyadhense]